MAQQQASPTKHREPIAIVGIGCRFPGGVDSPDRFWDLLRDGVDAVGDVPGERAGLEADFSNILDQDGNVTTRQGGFLPGIDRFDAAFFGIAPREASQLDPQQRLLLETTWEALEDAGLTQEQLAGSRAGVYIGLWLNDFEARLYESLDEVELYTTTGGGRYPAAGRVSFALDLRGPSLTVDTACSSSLVATHLAVQALRSGETNLALAGGVNVILQPQISIAYSRSGMLAADGRSKFGDARADGYVRSEGCGVVVLKRLSDALANEDPIYALIRGSAVNNDGRGSNLLVQPSTDGQTAMLRSAYADAGVDPASVGYIEAHGTGTLAGDPVELQAIGSVIGARRPGDNRCLVGSVKTNVGHTEGAAGVAGLIKVALALKHGAIPASLHFEQPSPRIAWDSLPIAIPTCLTPWPAGDTPRYGGVSGFGITGTNAHIVLEEAPQRTVSNTPGEEDDRPILLPISARSDAALRALAGRYATHIRDTTDIRSLAHTAATRRSHLAERLAVTGTSREMLADRLNAFASDLPAPGVVRASANSEAAPLVFVFPGQGGQWVGMGLRLAATEPAFAAALERCAAAIEAETGWALLDVLRAPEEHSRLGEIGVVQPAIFAIQVALAALFAEWGVKPDVVVGHSLGEVAAAHVAGILSLEDAAAVICRRSRLLTRVAGRGGMGVAGVSLDEATSLVANYDGRLSVAASNGPTTTVLAGDVDALDEALATVQAQGGFARRVQVDVASHSPHVEPLLADLETQLAGLNPQPARTGFASTVTGGMLAGPEMGPAYWARNLRQPVLFGPVIADLTADAEPAFLELSPHPVLLGSIESVPASVAVGALRRGQDEAETIREALGALWAAGVPLDWPRVQPGKIVLPLPAYPWQRERYWFTKGKRAQRRELLARPATAQFDDWLYTLEWRATATPDRASTASGEWLILADDGGLGARLATSMQERGVRARLVHATTADPGVHSQILGEFVDTGRDDLSGVIDLRALDSDEADLPVAAEHIWGPALALAQALARGSGGRAARLWFVTRGAQPVAGPPSNPAMAALWGLGRVVANEHPEHWGGMIDLDPLASAGEMDALCDIVLNPAGEDELAVRSGERFVARLTRHPGLMEAAVTFRPDAAYLITGGTGGIGLMVARWMLASGIRNLILAGRRAPQAVSEILAGLDTPDASVTYVQMDLANKTEVENALATIAGNGPPLRGIIHCAADTVDATLLQQTNAGFSAVFGPKAAGAWNLAAASRELPLDFLALFSSIGALLGLPGLANYVAANATVDALAHWLRASGVPALSIGWGHWHDVGLAAPAGRRESFERRGLEPMPAAAGITALGHTLTLDTPYLAVVNIDWSRYLAHTGIVAPRFRDLAAEIDLEDSTTASPGQADLRARLGDTVPNDRHDLLLENVRAHAAAVLHIDDPKRIPPRQGFNQMGMDSLLAVELKNRLQQVLGLSLPPTVAFDYPTPMTLTRHLLDELFASEPAFEPATAAPDMNGDLPELTPDELHRLLDAELQLIDKELGS